jgi:hypothetical protein
MLASLPLLAALSLTGCSGGSDDKDAGDSGDVGGPTYHGAIAPILSVNCWGCHTAGGMNQETLFDTPESAQMYAPLLANLVDSGAMPPFYAEETEECPNPWGWKHDPNLSEEDMGKIMDWAAAGGPIGDPDTAVEVPPPSTNHLQDANVTGYPLGTYTTLTAAEETDTFVCLSIDPGLTSQRWLEAFEVLPDNAEVVHHALAGIDYTGASAAYMDENGFYPCFGGFNPGGVVIDGTFIGGWIPGSGAIEFPEVSALRMPAGSRIMLQMHYHNADTPQQDGTGIALRFADGPPVREAYIGLLGNAASQDDQGYGLQPGDNDIGAPAFRVPADTADHTETMLFPVSDGVPRNSHLFMVANHMHYVGRDMKVVIKHGPNAPEPGTESCALHTPYWDFDWQQFYFYETTKAAPQIWPGDEIELRCIYDNVTSNPGVARALAEAGLTETQDVYLGEGTLNEMCIIVSGQVFDVPLHVEDETHIGESDLVVGVSGSPFSCSGPASVNMELPGSFEAVTACGIDIGAQLVTVEIALSGSVDKYGAMSGEGLITVLGLTDSTTFTWSGSFTDDQVQIPISASGTFSGLDVAFVGTLMAE